MDLQDIHKRQDRYWDSMIQGFEEHLRAVIAKAQAKLSGYLAENLTLENGQIARTPANYRIMRTLDQKFISFLNEAGYESLINAFVNAFPSQQPFLQDTLDYIGQATGQTYGLDFSVRDLNAFAAFRLNAVSSLEAVAETAGRTAMQQALLSIAGLKFTELVESLAEKFQASIPRATTIAESAMTTFYRTMADTNFQKIEFGFKELQYRYSGPEDLKNRPFCHKLLMKDLGYTRDQIAQMDNGQIPNVLISCGGWNCRHMWIIDTRPLEKKLGGEQDVAAQ